METVLTFGASLIVSLLSIPFSAFQRDRVIDAVERLVADALKDVQKATATATATSDKTGPLVDRTHVGSLLSQALDVATGFPSAVLTAVAYLSLIGSESLPATLVLLAAVAVTLGLAWLASPNNLSWYLRLQTGKRGGGKYGVSLVTSLLVVANVVGCATAIYQLITVQ